MVIKEMPLKDLIHYENNPRKNDHAVEAVTKSIKEFGFKVPIVIDSENVIIAGHTRAKAAEQLGLKKVPCIIADDLTPEQVRAFRIADNKTGEFAEWDMELLTMELAELDGMFTGFDDLEIGRMVGDKYKEVEDVEVPEPPEVPTTKRGDIWQLGRHRLMCGDSTKEKDVKQLIGEHKSKLLFTSPPYSDMREYKGDKDLNVGNIVKFIHCYEPFAEIQAVNLGIQRKDGEVFPYWNAYIDMAQGTGLKLLAWNVWDKLTCGSIGQQSAMIPIRHEWIFCFGRNPVQIKPTWRKKEASIYASGRRRKVRQADGSLKVTGCGNTSGAFKNMESLLEIPEQTRLESVTKQVSERGKVRSDHPAVFPVALPAEYIVAFTEVGGVVIEPFGGAGTTLIACEQLGRICYTMELDEGYCDVIIKRWENYTDQKAVLVNE